MEDLKGKKGAVLIAAGFQDEEGVEPVRFLAERGMEMTYVGLEQGPVTGKYEREEVEVTLTVDEANPDLFDFLFIPGGAAPEALRLNEHALSFTRAFFDAGKPVAAICRGPQVLISARVLAGRTLTCFAGIRDDVALAGALYRDKPVVTDGNLVTSRIPADIPAFNEAVAALLAPPEPEPAKGKSKRAKKKDDEAVEAEGDEAAEAEAAGEPAEAEGDAEGDAAEPEDDVADETAETEDGASGDTAETDLEETFENETIPEEAADTETPELKES